MQELRRPQVVGVPRPVEYDIVAHPAEEPALSRAASLAADRAVVMIHEFQPVERTKRISPATVEICCST
jgi:hypothetical protein